MSGSPDEVESSASSNRLSHTEDGPEIHDEHQSEIGPGEQQATSEEVEHSPSTDEISHMWETPEETYVPEPGYFNASKCSSKPDIHVLL